MPTALLLLLLALAEAAVIPVNLPPALTITLGWGTFSKIQTDVQWGTPAGKPIPTVIDTASSGFWVFGPNSTITGSHNGHESVCEKPVKTFYDWQASSSHSALESSPEMTYQSRLHEELVFASTMIQDRLAPINKKWPGLPSMKVALSNETQFTIGKAACDVPESDIAHSVLGLSTKTPHTEHQPFPSFREHLLDQKRIASTGFCMWFDKEPQDIKEPYKGMILFGGVPHKPPYAGDLIRVRRHKPRHKESRPLFQVRTPRMEVKMDKVKTDEWVRMQPVQLDHGKKVRHCVLDSRASNLTLPLDMKSLTDIAGIKWLQAIHGPDRIAYSGPCVSIPAEAKMKFTWRGTRGPKHWWMVWRHHRYISIEMPLRALARGDGAIYPEVLADKFCTLNIELDPNRCVLGAPFFTSAFIAIHDGDKNEIALAQGGVSSNTVAYPGALGRLIPFRDSQSIPGSV